MNITIDDVDVVMRSTDVDYPDARQALLETDGNVEAAVRALTMPRKDLYAGKDNGADVVNEFLEKAKSLLRTASVYHLVIRRRENLLVNIPVLVAVIILCVGLAAAPWMVIAGIIALFGFSCKIRIVRGRDF